MVATSVWVISGLLVTAMSQSPDSRTTWCGVWTVEGGGLGPVASVCSSRDGGGRSNRKVGGKWKGGKKRVLLAACTRKCFKLQLHTYWGCNTVDDGNYGDYYYVG